MASIKVEVKGLRELGERMRTLSSDVSNKIARSATGRAASIVKKRARNRIKSSPAYITGSLYDAVIVKRIPKGETALTSEHIVTVRGKNKRQRRKPKGKQSIAPHAHFIEFGVDHKTEFGTLRVPAEPFLRPSIDNGRQELLDAITAKLEAGIIKAGR